MTKMTYGEQLAHPNWQRKRLRVLELAGWRCAECHSGDKTIHVHHRQYIKGRMAWEYEDDDLQALCKDCHKAHHDEEQLLQRILLIAAKAEGGTAAAIGLLAGYFAAEEFAFKSEISEPELMELGAAIASIRRPGIDIFHAFRLRIAIEQDPAAFVAAAIGEPSA